MAIAMIMAAVDAAKYISVGGKVISGMDVVDKIAAVPTNANDKPLQNVTIISATIMP